MGVCAGLQKILTNAALMAAMETQLSARVNGVLFRYGLRMLLVPREKSCPHLTEAACLRPGSKGQVQDPNPSGPGED